MLKSEAGRKGRALRRQSSTPGRSVPVPSTSYRDKRHAQSLDAAREADGASPRRPVGGDRTTCEAAGQRLKNRRKPLSTCPRTSSNGDRRRPTFRCAGFLWTNVRTPRRTGTECSCSCRPGRRREGTASGLVRVSAGWTVPQGPLPEPGRRRDRHPSARPRIRAMSGETTTAAPGDTLRPPRGTLNASR